MDSFLLYCPLIIATDYYAPAVFVQRQFNPPVYDLATHTRGAYIWRSTFLRRIVKYGLHQFPRDFKLLIRKQEAHEEKNNNRANAKKRKKKNKLEKCLKNL